MATGDHSSACSETSDYSEENLQLDLSFSSSDFSEDFDHEVERNEQLSIGPYRFEPVESDISLSSFEDDTTTDERRLLTTDWCSCQLCSVSPTVEECVCCQEISRITDLLENTDGQQASCITNHPGFEPVCINRYVLQTAYHQYRQQYGGEIVESNELYRYTAYRQFVRWIWGYLGKKIRVVIPSCAVSVIRSNFPSTDGTYVGFNPPE